MVFKILPVRQKANGVSPIKLLYLTPWWVSRPWSRESIPWWIPEGSLSWGEGAENLGRPRQLEFLEQSTGEERASQRVLLSPPYSDQHTPHVKNYPWTGKDQLTGLEATVPSTHTGLDAGHVPIGRLENLAVHQTDTRKDLASVVGNKP